MKKQIVLISLSLALCANIPSAKADEGFLDWLKSFSRHKEITPVTDEIYNKECGSCHFPYQPGLLPEASWRELMTAKALSDHFGDSAELDETTRLHLLEIMVAESADKSYAKRSRKIMASLEGVPAPKRITEIPYMKAKHEDIPEALIAKNEQVKSLSYCNKCHQKAAEGVFDDDTVQIPGKPR